MLCISNMEYSWTEDQKELRMRKMGWLPKHEKILKQELEDAMKEGEKLFQEDQELKKELESLKQFELDRILDASMCEIFTTERQFLKVNKIL